MPGFTTHYLFGVDAYKKISLDSVKRNLHKNHNAFALGLQGPDVFFYYLPCYLLVGQNIGDLAHRKDTCAFFSYLMESRDLFEGRSKDLAIADAYITGFIGHYTLDCAVHPYVYAFTKYDPKHPKKDSEYFGQHAYFETELDNEVLYKKKHITPSRFHQSATIHLSSRQRKVISKMLCHAYHNTYPSVKMKARWISSATHWMKIGTKAMHDPSGQKKVIVRFVEKIAFDRPFISPMLASDHLTFVMDPMNLAHKAWVHPWTKKESKESFLDLYKKAMSLYLHRVNAYYKMLHEGFTMDGRKEFALREYGNRSFLSGLEPNR